MSGGGFYGGSYGFRSDWDGFRDDYGYDEFRPEDYDGHYDYQYRDPRSGFRDHDYGDYTEFGEDPNASPEKKENSFVIVFNLDYKELLTKGKKDALTELKKAYLRMVRHSVLRRCKSLMHYTYITTIES